MSEFKVGDRVEFYFGDDKCEGIIKKVKPHGRYEITDDDYIFYDTTIDNITKITKEKKIITLEALEQRIEKLEKCVMGEQNSLEKCANVSSISEFTKEEIEAFNYWKDENYKWACKDENGSIHIFEIKPTIYNIEELLKGECGNE